jgi:hypothetical protein
MYVGIVTHLLKDRMTYSTSIGTDAIIGIYMHIYLEAKGLHRLYAYYLMRYGLSISE